MSANVPRPTHAPGRSLESTLGGPKREGRLHLCDYYKTVRGEDILSGSHVDVGLPVISEENDTNVLGGGDQLGAANPVLEVRLDDEDFAWGAVR